MQKRMENIFNISSKLVKINYCKSSEMENLFLISSLHPLSTFLENIILSSPLL